MFKRCYFHTLIPTLFLLATLPSIVFAATVLVPTDSATVQGAISAANDGDTVLIEDSGIYVESVSVAKMITLMAAPGQNPTLQYDTANPFPDSYMIFCSSAGAQCGSNAGGQITLDGACSNNISVFLATNVNNGEVIFENLRCINGHPSGQFIYPDPAPGGPGGGGASAFTFNNIIGECAGCNMVGPTARFDDPDFPIRPDFLEGSTLNLNFCKITDADRMCILHGGSDIPESFGVVNIHGSILTGRELAITSEPPSRPITWTVTDSVLESTIDPVEGSIFGGFAAWWVRSSGQVIGATRSVLQENGIGRAFYPWFPGDDSLITLDHCDIISVTNIGVHLGPPTLAQPRVLSFRNCNIFAPDSAGYFGSIAGPDVFLNDYNNVVGGYDGLELVNPDIMGPNDIVPPIIPDYTDPVFDAYNYEYTDGTLLASDEFGGPVGSFQIFGAPPPPTPTPIPSSDVGKWSLYQ